MERMAKRLAALAAAVCLMAAGARADPVDWNAVAAEQTVVILTVEADGSPRETTVWLVVVDGQGYIRTGNTHWHANIVREPQIAVRVAGAEHAVTADHVTDEPLRARIEKAFNDKYGFSDTFVGWFTDRENANILALVPRMTELTN